MNALQSGLWPLVLAAGALLCLVGLSFSIVRLVRTLRDAVEATVALAPTMRVELRAAGPKTIYFKGPRFISIRKLKLTLTDAQGHAIALTRIRFPLSARGGDVRIGFAHCVLPAPGTYTVGAQEIPSAARPLSLLICRPHTLQTVGWIAAIVVSACGMIGGSVLALVLAVA